MFFFVFLFVRLFFGGERRVERRFPKIAFKNYFHLTLFCHFGKSNRAFTFAIFYQNTTIVGKWC